MRCYTEYMDKQLITTVRVSKQTRQRLGIARMKDETMDMLISRLLSHLEPAAKEPQAVVEEKAITTTNSEAKQEQPAADTAAPEPPKPEQKEAKSECIISGW